MDRIEAVLGQKCLDQSRSEIGVLTTSKMYFRRQFKNNGNTLLLSYYAAVLLIITEEWRNSGTCGYAKQLAPASSLIIGEKIGGRLILLQVRLEVDSSSALGKGKRGRSIELLA